MSEIQNLSLYDAMLRALLSVRQNFSARILGPLGLAASSMRSAGISIKEAVCNFVNMLKELICDFLPSLCRSTLDLVCNFMCSFINDRIASLMEFIDVNSRDWRSIIIYLSNVFILIVSFSLPPASFGIMGKLMMAMASCVCILSKSLLATGVNTFFFTLLLKTRPAHQVFSVNLQAEGDTTFRRDFTEWLQQAIMAVSMMGLCIAGLDFPTDKKSLNDFLQRSAILGRSYQTWSIMSEKIVDLFDHSYKMIFKYFYGLDYCSVKSIPDVERLFVRTMQLCKLSEAVRIQSDPDKMEEIEAMYILYHEYLKTYGNDPTIRGQLQEIGKVLTFFYKQVSAKNPKSYVMRQEPVCVVFHGRSGVGKSYLMTPLQQDLCKISGVIGEKGDFTGKIYSRCTEHEFWDGYSGQPIVLYDDFGQQIDSEVKPNPEFFEIIRTVNMFPYQLHSAALETKANNAFRAHFVVCTTNLPTFHPKSIIEPEAFQRRMHLVYEVLIKDEVKGTFGLDDGKLQQYRNTHSLPLSDMSHYTFKNNMTNKLMSYDEIVVEISKKYEKHYVDFQRRQLLAKEKETEKLPEGAFTVDSRWQYQAENFSIPLPIWIRLSSDTRYNLSRMGCDVYDSTYAYLNPTDLIINDITMLKKAVEADSACCLYLSKGQKLSQSVRDLIHEFLMRDDLTISTVKNLNEEFLTSFGRIHYENSSYLKKSFYNLWQALDRFVTFSKTHYSSMIKAIAFIGVATLATVGLAELKKLIFKIKASFVTTRLSKEEVIGLLCSLDIGTSLMSLLLYPKYGFVNTASALLNWYNHYTVHNSYVENCPTCSHHKVIHEGIMLDKDLKRTTQLEDIEHQVQSLRFAVREKLEHIGDDFKLPTMEEKYEAFKTTAQRFKEWVRLINEPGYDGDPYEDLKKYDVLPPKKIRDLQKRKDYTVESPSKESTPTRVKTSYEEELESPSKEHQVSNWRTRYESPDSDISKIFRGVPVKTEGVLSENATQVANLIRKNMYDIRVFFVRDGQQLVKRIGTTTLIRGHKALINYHFIQKCGQYVKEFGQTDSFQMMMCIPEQEEGHEFSVEHLLTAKPVYRGECKTEFYIWQVPKSVPLAADISKHFIHPDNINKLHNGVRLKVVTYEKDGLVLRRVAREGDFIDITTIELEDAMNPDIIHHYPKSAKYSISTQPGDCGAPVIINSTAFAKNILGFHFGGSPGFGTCSVITFKDIEKHVRKEKEGMNINSLDINSQKVELQADFILPLKGSFQQIGKTSRPIVHPVRTTLRPSLVHGFNGPTTMAPALLRPSLTPDGPMIKGLQKNQSSVRLVNPVVLDIAVGSYLEKMDKYPGLEIENRVLTFEEACAGIPGERYFPPLKRSKSAGWPWLFDATKGKTDWLGSTEWDFSSPECQHLRKIVHEAEEQCRLGQVPEAYFIDTLKDEKRPLEKVNAGKTRTFSAAPMHFSILFRKYFLGFIAYISRTRYTNECAVGTNVYSEDWRHLAEELLRFGDDGFTDGDFVNFDGTINYYIFDRIIEIVNRFYADSPQNQLVRRMLWEIITRAPHILYDLVYIVSHGQPSGNPATAPFNSIYVSLAMRYCIGLIDINLLLKFNHYFILMTYGDDFILSVLKKFRHLVNGKTLDARFQEIGMGLTDANKQPHDGSFHTLSEIRFLKRGFAYDEELKWWFAPIEPLSITEMCNWIRKSPSDLKATMVNVNTAQYELFHHPEYVYDEFVRKLQGVYKEKTRHMLTWMPWKSGRTLIVTGEILELCENLMCI